MVWRPCAERHSCRAHPSTLGRLDLCGGNQTPVQVGQWGRSFFFLLWPCLGGGHAGAGTRVDETAGNEDDPSATKRAVAGFASTRAYGRRDNRTTTRRGRTVRRRRAGSCDARRCRLARNQSWSSCRCRARAEIPLPLAGPTVGHRSGDDRRGQRCRLRRYGRRRFGRRTQHGHRDIGVYATDKSSRSARIFFLHRLSGRVNLTLSCAGGPARRRRACPGRIHSFHRLNPRAAGKNQPISGPPWASAAT